MPRFKKFFLIIFCLLSLTETAVCEHAIFQAVRENNWNEVLAQLNENPGLINTTDQNGKTLLIHAAIWGDLEVVKTILGKKSDLFHAVDSDGFSAMAYAHLCDQRRIFTYFRRIEHTIEAPITPPLTWEQRRARGVAAAEARMNTIHHNWRQFHCECLQLIVSLPWLRVQAD